MPPASDVRPLQVSSGSATLIGDDVGDGGAIVGLHAGVADRRSWRPLRPYLTPTHRLVTYDRRGFGDTTYTPELHDPIADLLAVLDATSIPDAALMGNSMGGRLAIDATLLHPDRVRALILIGSAISGATYLSPEELDAPVRALADALEAAEHAGDTSEINRLEAHYWLDGPAAAAGRVSGDARELFLDMNRRALLAGDVGSEVTPEPAFDRLGSIAVPTLVIVGALDEPDVVAHAHHLADQIPDATLVIVDDTAHLPQLERPEQVGRTVADFLVPG